MLDFFGLVCRGCVGFFILVMGLEIKSVVVRLELFFFIKLIFLGENSFKEERNIFFLREEIVFFFNFIFIEFSF